MLSRAENQASRLGESTVGTEHLLLTLVQDNHDPGVAVHVLKECGIDLPSVRREVLIRLSRHPWASQDADEIGPTAETAEGIAAREREGIPPAADARQLPLFS